VASASPGGGWRGREREEHSLGVRAAAEFVAPIEVRTRPAATLRTRALVRRISPARKRVRSSSGGASLLRTPPSLAGGQFYVRKAWLNFNRVPAGSPRLHSSIVDRRDY
jgi:hypothetical protein